MPKKVMVSDTRARGVDDESFEEDYYNMDDLRVGNNFNVLGRTVLLYDCDSYTQSWYLENRGIDQKAGTLEISEPVPEPRVVPVPPPTWFGTEADSMASVKHLVPRVPKPDFAKISKFADKTLRFSATLESTKPVDAGRSFVLTWCAASR